MDTSSTNSEEYVYAYYPIEATYLQRYEFIQNGIIPTIQRGFNQVVYASDGTNPQYDSSSEFVINDSLYNEDIGDFYDYSWSSGNVEDSNLSISNSVTNSCKVYPATKYDNGISNNFVKVSLNTSEAKIEAIKLESGKAKE